MERCAFCAMQAIKKCAHCGQPLCEEHLRLFVEQGRTKYLCIPCDDRRQPPPNWPSRR